MPRHQKNPESIRASLTERQQFWLKHLEKADARGETIRDYAARKDLSVHSLYSSRKRLGQLGMTFAEPTTDKSSRVAFDRVQVAPRPAPPSIAWRLRFPNGAVLESSTALTAEVGASLLAGITRLP